MAKTKKSKDGKVRVSGKRKTAIAQAIIQEGSGNIKINKKSYESLPMLKKLMIQEPIEITKKVLGDFNFDININVKGGGQSSQIEASRLAIARAIVEIAKSQELKKAFAPENHLIILKKEHKEHHIKHKKNKLFELSNAPILISR